jgi:uncharacterized membrane protein (DUF485 family)
MNTISRGETAYRESASKRKQLVVTLVPVVVGYYFAMIVIVNFTTWLDGYAIGSVSWAYVVAFSQFVMAVAVTLIYRSRMEAIEMEFAAASSNLQQDSDAK